MLSWLKNLFVGPFVVVFLGITIIAIAEVFKFYGDKKEKPKLQRVGLIVLVSGLLVGGIGGWWAAKEQFNFERKIFGSVTGGDSFCYFLPILDSLERVSFILGHYGKYPLYDVSIQIYDDTKLGNVDWGKVFKKHFGFREKKIKTEELKEFYSKEASRDRALKSDAMEKEIREIQKEALLVNRKNVGTVTPENIGQQFEILEVKLPCDQLKQEYTINIYARNGYFRQKISYQREKNHWEMTSKVYKHISENERLLLRELKSSHGGTIVHIVK